MAEVPHNLAWIIDIFSWEKFSYALTVFTILISTAVVPLYNMFKRRKDEKAKEKELMETDKMTSISNKVVNPVIERIDKYEEIQADLRDDIKEITHTNKELLHEIKDFTIEFTKYKEQQHLNSSKISFIEGFLQQYLKKNPHPISSQQQQQQMKPKQEEEEEEEGSITANSIGRGIKPE